MSDYPQHKSLHSDNGVGVPIRVLAAIYRANELGGEAPSYGKDALTESVHHKLADLFRVDESAIASRFTFTGTGANQLAISSLVPRRGLIVCTSKAHEFIACLICEIEEFLRDNGTSLNYVDLISVSTAGLSKTDSNGTKFIKSVNIPALRDGVPLEHLLQEASQIPVVSLNDGTAAALAEQGQPDGAAYGNSNVIVVSLGTGCIDGTVFHGQPVFFQPSKLDGSFPLEDLSNRNSAEIGHVQVSESVDAPPCPCGGVGHLESFIGGGALRSQGIDPAQNMALLRQNTLRYLPITLRPLIEKYATEKVVLTGGIGKRLADLGNTFLAELAHELGVSVVKGNFENASLRGAERYGVMSLSPVESQLSLDTGIPS